MISPNALQNQLCYQAKIKQKQASRDQEEDLINEDESLELSLLPWLWNQVS